MTGYDQDGVKGTVLSLILVDTRRTDCNKKQVIVYHAAEVERASANFRTCI